MEAVKELETGLKKLNNTSYSTIDKLMRNIMKKNDMTAKELHNAFVEKHKKTPDAWINEMKDPKGPVKPYRSPQEISQRLHVPLSKIMKQVKVGTKVEGEHTTSKSGARITALQHVDELPDYYTKLKKIEKKKSVKESLEVAKMGLEGKRYCKLCRKAETQNECSYGPEMWTRFSIATVHPANEGVLGEKKGLWDNIHAKRKRGEKPAKPGEKGYPKTLDVNEDHKEIASGKKKDEEGYMARVEFDQIDRAVEILRKKINKGNQQIPAWVQSKITRAADFIDTAADYMQSDENVSEGLKQAQQNVGASKCWTGKKVGKPPTKMKGGKEVPNCVPANEDSCISFSQFMKLSEEWKPLPKEKMVSKMQEKDRVRTLSQRNPSDTRISKKEPISKVKEKSRIGREAKLERQSNMMKLALKNPEGYRSKGSQPLPRKKSISESSPAWQRKEGKNPKGGLNEKGRKSYERENPGSDLKAPQPEGGPRKRSFCARMGGMPGPMKDEKGRPTRKALSLRKWNC